MRRDQTSALTAALDDTADDLLRYFRRRVRYEDAADLFAETLTTAWRRRTDIPDDLEQARRWLFAVAHRILLNHARGEGRRLALADRLRVVLQTVESAAPPADRGMEVRDAIESLPHDLAEIVRLIHWEGFAVAEAAVVLGVSATTARDRYRRARETLRETLEVDVHL